MAMLSASDGAGDLQMLHRGVDEVVVAVVEIASGRPSGW